MSAPEWYAAAQAHLVRVEPRFKPFLSTSVIPPPAPAKRVDLFAALTHAIVNQQLSSKAAHTIYTRLLALFPKKRLHPKSVGGLTDAQLRGVGLSGMKVRFLRSLAQASLAGELPTSAQLHRLSNEELLDRLTALDGIGPWTVHMLMMFKLGRSDVFPVADLGVVKGFQKIMGMKKRPSPDYMLRKSRPWAPYRTLAAWYCWRVFDIADFHPSPGQSLWSFKGE